MPDLPRLADDHIDSVISAVSRLSPRWTAWTLQTIQQRGSMRLADINSALPWVGVQAMAQVVRRMQTSGLLERPQFGIYSLTPLGRNAQAVHRALADWHRTQIVSNAPTLARAERTEDALGRLRGKGAIEVLHALAQHGPLSNGELRTAAGLATGSFHYRVHQLQTDQLITRIGPFTGRGANYTLTPAARALAPVYPELSDFARKSNVIAGTDEVQHAAAAEHAATAVRASAATQRSTMASPGLFSHAPAPQPRVPAHVAALSHPSRIR
ncbi:winged helix-turn-helix transcriptional regulator [Streptomyces shenzhenensis]|uniref:winged helix-turn-helix transcriptional regulator n=1 Tax=Streptomyces shenzhenensis TaxID=943815 RepID=UPI0033FA8A8F